MRFKELVSRAGAAAAFAAEDTLHCVLFLRREESRPVLFAEIICANDEICAALSANPDLAGWEVFLEDDVVGYRRTYEFEAADDELSGRIAHAIEILRRTLERADELEGAGPWR